MIEKFRKGPPYYLKKEQKRLLEVEDYIKNITLLKDNNS